MARRNTRGRDASARAGRGRTATAFDVESLQSSLELSAGAAEGTQVRRVLAPSTGKAYLCPGCQQEIPAGTNHVVVVPNSAPDLRRHWHTSCWLMRDRRRPGR